MTPDTTSNLLPVFAVLLLVGGISYVVNGVTTRAKARRDIKRRTENAAVLGMRLDLELGPLSDEELRQFRRFLATHLAVIGVASTENVRSLMADARARTIEDQEQAKAAAARSE
ncbi:hypothetical protein ACFSBZ_08905 [Amnibacterium flavum]|uniref:Uncharacterized protein n=1 Tax=Amnibacterium flavum TaxID=2173173 RepID=A0A2V1HR23_9MICO|nr:hypothetical protein [Amnibacterium flavum]PVZ94988.1 hypothetical protein DDQ50_00145 [Amnibacterium flavum]